MPLHCVHSSINMNLCFHWRYEYYFLSVSRCSSEFFPLVLLIITYFLCELSLTSVFALNGFNTTENCNEKLYRDLFRTDVSYRPLWTNNWNWLWPGYMIWIANLERLTSPIKKINKKHCGEQETKLNFRSIILCVGSNSST